MSRRGARPVPDEATGAYWDARAASFDDEPDHGLGDPEVREAWRDLLRAELPTLPCDVVDLGCGTGSLAVLAAQEGHRVLGLDHSHAMVSVATGKAARSGVTIVFRRGDAGAPDLPAASCDVVLARHVLWALPDPATALARWAGLLRPGGRMVLVEGRWHTGGGLAPEETLGLLDDLGLPGQLRRLDHDRRLWGGPVPDVRYLVSATLPG